MADADGPERPAVREGGREGRFGGGGGGGGGQQFRARLRPKPLPVVKNGPVYTLASGSACAYLRLKLRHVPLPLRLPLRPAAGRHYRRDRVRHMHSWLPPSEALLRDARCRAVELETPAPACGVAMASSHPGLEHRSCGEQLRARRSCRPASYMASVAPHLRKRPQTFSAADVFAPIRLPALGLRKNVQKRPPKCAEAASTCIKMYRGACKNEKNVQKQPRPPGRTSRPGGRGRRGSAPYSGSRAGRM